MTRGNKYVYNILHDLPQEEQISIVSMLATLHVTCFSEQNYGSICNCFFVSHVLIFKMYALSVGHLNCSNVNIATIGATKVWDPPWMMGSLFIKNRQKFWEILMNIDILPRVNIINLIWIWTYSIVRKQSSWNCNLFKSILSFAVQYFSQILNPSTEKYFILTT